MKEKQSPNSPSILREGASTPKIQLVNNGASVPKMETQMVQRGASVPEIPKTSSTSQSDSKGTQEQK